MVTRVLEEADRQAVKNRRELLGLSQAAVAEKIEVAQATISNIESGSAPVSIKTIKKVTDFLTTREREQDSRTPSNRVEPANYPGASGGLAPQPSTTIAPWPAKNARGAETSLKIARRYDGIKYAIIIAAIFSSLCAFVAAANATPGQDGDEADVLRLLQFFGIAVVACIAEWRIRCNDTQLLLGSTAGAILFFVLAYTGLNWYLGTSFGLALARLFLFICPALGSTANALATLFHSFCVVAFAFVVFMDIHRAAARKVGKLRFKAGGRSEWRDVTLDPGETRDRGDAAEMKQDQRP